MLQAIGRIHYDASVKRISVCKKARYYDSEHDVIQFDLLLDSRSGRRRTAIQVSPKGKVNVYLEEKLTTEDINEVFALLRELIVDELGCEVKLEPVMVFYSKTRPSPSWLTNLLLALRVPVRISPKPYQMIASSIKTVRKLHIVTPTNRREN